MAHLVIHIYVNYVNCKYSIISAASSTCTSTVVCGSSAVPNTGYTVAQVMLLSDLDCMSDKQKKKS
jgi:hypothetical protein